MKYFAYGSNMLTQRLAARVPSAANPLKFALHGYSLHFHKRSDDRSGKCNIVKTDAQSAVVYGVIFDVADGEIGILDEAEGAGYGYRRDSLILELNGMPQAAAVYLAEADYINDALRPYRWYRDLVLAGAEQHALPPDYRLNLEAIPFDEDPKPNRKTKLEAERALKAYAELKKA